IASPAAATRSSATSSASECSGYRTNRASIATSRSGWCPMGDLDGRTVLITGAARGLGAAIAKTCVGHGASVILGDILRDERAATDEELGPSARAVHLDVTQAGSWDDVARIVRADH